jgi:hypothetical protein
VGGHEHRTCPDQGTASLELAGATEGGATTKPEALLPGAQGEAEHGPVLPPREDPVEGKRGPGGPPRETPCEGTT